MSALILFDFDGTLADTAPTWPRQPTGSAPARAWNPCPTKPCVRSPRRRARLLRVALGLKPGDADYEPTRLQFLEDYAAESTVHSCSPASSNCWPASASVACRGIVTNKVTYLTLPIVEYLDLTRESLQHAAREAGFAVERCVYVGDDLRDIQAAHAAGMPWPRPMAMWAKTT